MALEKQPAGLGKLGFHLGSCQLQAFCFALYKQHFLLASKPLIDVGMGFPSLFLTSFHQHLSPVVMHNKY